MKKALLLSACLFVMALISSCGGGSATPADEALKCVELIQNGDYEALVDEIQMKEDATAEEIAQFKEMMVAMGKEKGAKQIEAKGGIASYKVVKEDIAEDGQTAKVEVEVTYGNGKTEIEKYNMALVDGNWKMSLDK